MSVRIAPTRSGIFPSDAVARRMLSDIGGMSSGELCSRTNEVWTSTLPKRSGHVGARPSQLVSNTRAGVIPAHMAVASVSESPTKLPCWCLQLHAPNCFGFEDS